MRKYIDTHCHLNGEFYNTDVATDIRAAQEVGVTAIIVPGTSESDSRNAQILARQFPIVHACAGLHPCSATSLDASSFLLNVDPRTVVAIGETGIDLYHRETNPSLALQIANFQQHILFAKKHNKPLIVHARDAEQEVYNQLAKHSGLQIIMHCYTGDWAWAERFLSLGAYISLSGALTYSKTPTINHVAQMVPLNRLLVETDAPFLTPIPHRGQVNRPAFVQFTADHLANLRTENDEDVIAALYQNALRAFKL